MSHTDSVERRSARKSLTAWLPLTLLGLLLLFRLLLLVPAAPHVDRSVLTDSQGYLELAEGLLNGKTFGSGEPMLGERTPGYPVFIAAIQWIAGPRLAPVIVVQVLLSVALAALLYRLGDLAAGRTVGWAAAFLWALNPNSVFWPFTILSETLFAFLLIGSSTTLVLALRRESRWMVATSGLLLGLAILVRPIGLFLVPVWGGVLLVRGVRHAGWRRGWHVAAFATLTASALILAWTWRNYLVHQEAFFSKGPAASIRSFILASALADARGISRSEASPLIPLTADMDVVAAEIFAESPWSFPRVIAGGVLRTALGTEAGTWLWIFGIQSSGQGLMGSLLRGDLARIAEVGRSLLASREVALYWVLAIWGAAYAIVAWAAAILGWVRNHRRLDWVGATAHWVAALTVVYLAVAPLAAGDARFRVPVDPFLAFLGGIAWLGWRGFRWRGLPHASQSLGASGDP